MKVFKLSQAEVLTLAEAATRADAEGRTFKVAFTGTGLVYKVGGGMWTAPLGKPDND